MYYVMIFGSTSTPHQPSLVPNVLYVPYITSFLFYKYSPSPSHLTVSTVSIFTMKLSPSLRNIRPSTVSIRSIRPLTASLYRPNTRSFHQSILKMSFSNTDTGSKTADPYKAKNIDDVSIQEKVEGLSEFVTACKFGMMTTRDASSGDLTSRCMALAAKVCHP